MEAGVIAAIISVSGAVALGYANSFAAERYRRFEDGSALAAGLAGELASYEPAWPLLESMLGNVLKTIEAGRRDLTSFRKFERPKDLVFEEVVGKLGILGHHVVEDVVYVYSNLRAFRIAFELISEHHADMVDEEVRLRCESCLAALERAFARGRPLIERLQVRANENYSVWQALRAV